MSDRYSYGRFRRSYKRDGRHGWGWMVVDDEQQGSVAKVDTEQQAQRIADALNAGAIDRHDHASMRRLITA